MLLCTLSDHFLHFLIDENSNLDSMRCVVQKDTDEPLIPRANGTVLLPSAIQTPAMEYSIPTGEIPAQLFQEHWISVANALRWHH